LEQRIARKCTLLKSAMMDIGTHPWSSIREIRYWSFCRFSSLPKEKVIMSTDTTSSLYHTNRFFLLFFW